jgi:Domain of unknown function (DUF4145)
MKDWWDLGEWSGVSDFGNGIHGVDCAWCGVEDNFRVVHSVDQKHAKKPKVIQFQILQCDNCGNHTLVMQSKSSTHYGVHGLIGYRRIPGPLKVQKAPDNWPSDVGRYWLQAHRAAETKSWDSAAMTVRSALQLALRHKGASGSRLVDEIKDLVTKGALPPLMGEWATEVRLLGNDGTHPAPGDPGTSSADAQDALQFLDYMLEYLFTLPHRIDSYRQRKKP